jgi:hypothetical protein
VAAEAVALGYLFLVLRAAARLRSCVSWEAVSAQWGLLMLIYFAGGAANVSGGGGDAPFSYFGSKYGSARVAPQGRVVFHPPVANLFIRRRRRAWRFAATPVSLSFSHSSGAT